jgi:hypothetical protein
VCRTVFNVRLPVNQWGGSAGPLKNGKLRRGGGGLPIQEKPALFFPKPGAPRMEYQRGDEAESENNDLNQSQAPQLQLLP